MFTDPRSLVRTHLEIALLILTECRMDRDPSTAFVRSALDALADDAKGSVRLIVLPAVGTEGREAAPSAAPVADGPRRSKRPEM